LARIENRGLCELCGGED